MNEGAASSGKPTLPSSASSAAKRSSNESTEAPAKKPKTEQEILDVASHLELKAGSRVKVQWQVEKDGEPPIHHWWGATLLEHDGRSVEGEGVAIRVLEYDAFEEGGFPEKSKEDVIFMGRDVLVTYPDQEEQDFKILADDGSEVIFTNGDSEAVEKMVDHILSTTLEKHSAGFQALPRSQQGVVAEAIADRKEKLISLINDHFTSSSTLTAEDCSGLLAHALSDR